MGYPKSSFQPPPISIYQALLLTKLMKQYNSSLIKKRVLCYTFFPEIFASSWLVANLGTILWKDGVSFQPQLRFHVSASSAWLGCCITLEYSESQRGLLFVYFTGKTLLNLGLPFVCIGISKDKDRRVQFSINRRQPIGQFNQ